MLRIIILTLLLLLLPVVAIGHPAEITSLFGWRVHPITGEYHFHTGLDIGYEKGTPLGSFCKGTVVFSGVWSGYGNTIIIKDSSRNRHIVYAHCDQLYVLANNEVEIGQTVASVGSTGNSTGPHLHLELWEDGEYKNPIILYEGM